MDTETESVDRPSPRPPYVCIDPILVAGLANFTSSSAANLVHDVDMETPAVETPREESKEGTHALLQLRTYIIGMLRSIYLRSLAAAQLMLSPGLLTS